MINQIENEILKLKNIEKSKILQRFFKTWDWEYWYWDIFLWITVPQVRALVKIYNLDLIQIQYFLKSPYHEFRLFALLSLVKNFEKTKDINYKKEIIQFYLSNTSFINNWDLVDVSCYKILWRYCFEIKDLTLIYKLSKSIKLWEKRISIVSMMYFVKSWEIKDAVKIINSFLKDNHDLIAKACWWILREVWKINKDFLINYLIENKSKMKSVAYSYAKERVKAELINKIEQWKF